MDSRFSPGDAMQQEPVQAFIGLGSNLGDSERNLQLAAALVFSLKDVQPGRISQTYYTEPQGVKDQPWFANQVLQVYCTAHWSPVSFLQALFKIEACLGRTRNKTWEARHIDLDLLLFGQQVGVCTELTLPHPRMKQRAFVLVPLLEIAPELVLPNGQLIQQLLQNISYRLHANMIWQD